VAVSERVRERIRDQASNRCGYCRSRQEYVLLVLEVEHIQPSARGGTDDEANLWLSCRLCNQHKGVQTHATDPVTGRRTRLFNPRRQSWKRHFSWDGELIIGRTSCGRATVIGLNLNHPTALVVRRNWMAAGWHPPEE
jgi:hypothetical protein